MIDLSVPYITKIFDLNGIIDMYVDYGNFQNVITQNIRKSGILNLCKLIVIHLEWNKEQGLSYLKINSIIKFINKSK